MDAVEATERFREELLKQGMTSSLGPAAGDYGQKLQIQGYSGFAVIYAGKKGPRLVLQELKGLSSEQSNQLLSLFQACFGQRESTKPTKSRTAAPSDSPPGWVAYVDGSHHPTKGIGWGLVVLRQGEVVHESSGIVDHPDAESMHQVAGEMRAAMEAVQWAKAEGHDAITLAYDYKGVEAWVTGAYTARKPLTKRYRDWMRASGVSLSWLKVAAHSGDRWNDAADSLARSAIGL